MGNNQRLEGYVAYQNLVDEVFGKGEITIKADNNNPITAALTDQTNFQIFTNNFKNRLGRLFKKFYGRPSYADLCKTIADVGSTKNWDGAYAELVAYDVMSNDYLPGIIELNKTLPTDASFAGEMGHKATNEDGFISEMNLGFDVKILADTVRVILKKITDNAITTSGCKTRCDILPEYPLDDNDEDYSDNFNELSKELSDHISNHQQNGNSKDFFQSKVIPNLSYRIQWGAGVNSSEGEFDPYRFAEKCHNMILKRYTKKILKSNPFLLVLVKFPWYNNLINDFAGTDEIFYRSLARRTFCEYRYLPDKMSSIVPKYSGDETIYEVSRCLSGLIFIDDNSVTEDSYTSHIYLNPNAKNPIKSSIHYIGQIANKGLRKSIFDDMKHDNY